MLPESKNCSIIDINTLTLTKRSYFILNFRMQKLLMQFLVLYSGTVLRNIQVLLATFIQNITL